MRRIPFLLLRVVFGGILVGAGAGGTVWAQNPESARSDPLADGLKPELSWHIPSAPATNPAPIPSSLQEPSSTTTPSTPSFASPPSIDPTPFLPFVLNPLDSPDELKLHLLVIYNSNDPDSRGLARYYASRRGILPERLLGIPCPVTEEITRAQYEQTIRKPIISYLTQKGWLIQHRREIKVQARSYPVMATIRNEIWAIALMRGMPLKISEDITLHDSLEREPRLQTNAAAVDSELATLTFYGQPLGGFLPNPFFDEAVTGLARLGPTLATQEVLVTRLDGPKVSDVRRMIDDSILAERQRLAGLAVIDTRGLTDVTNSYTLGDTWLRSARRSLEEEGWTVKFDEDPKLIPVTDPCNHVAFYLGWYDDTAKGPWVTPPDRFVPGAIAYHLHSYSGATLRSETSHWVGPLIAHGADATMGTVYEPYLAATPHLDIFTKRLLAGQYFAEAAYAAQPGLSWMGTVIGDPLYRPFRQPIGTALLAAQAAHTANADWLLLQQVRQSLDAGRLTPNVETLKHFLDAPDSGPVAEEALGDLLQGNDDAGPSRSLLPEIEKAYQKALFLDSTPLDQIRIGLKLAQLYTRLGHAGQAQTELKWLRETYPGDAERFGIANPFVPTGTF